MTLYLLDKDTWTTTPIYEDDLNSRNRIPCPFHGGDGYNFHVTPPNDDGQAGWYKCHSRCGKGGAVLNECQERERRELEEEFKDRIDYDTEHKEISKKLIEPEVDPLEEVVPNKPKAEPDFSNVLRTHIYTDEMGNPISRKVIYGLKNGVNGKAPLQERFENNEWVKKLTYSNGKKVPRYLYNMVNIVKESKNIIFVEGEKDVDSLINLGLPQSTTLGSTTSKIDSEHAKHFIGKVVLIIPDDDEVGVEYANTVAETLVLNGVKNVVIGKLPNPNNQEGYDVSDYLQEHPETTKDNLLMILGKNGEKYQTPITTEIASAMDCAVNALNENKEDFGTWVQQYLEFPIDSMPEITRQPIKDYMKAKGQEADYIGTSILATSAIALGKTYKLNCKMGGWVVNNNLWFVLLGKPGVSKSDPISSATALLNLRQKETDTLHKNRLKEWEEREKARTRTRRGEHNDDGGHPDTEPIYTEQIYSSDTTTEGFVKAHMRSPRGVSVIVDELHSLLGSFNKYDSGKDGQNFWIECYEGKDHTINRAGEKHPQIAHELYANILGSTQPEVFQADMGGASSDNGFSGRFLICTPPAKRRTYTTQNEKPLAGLYPFFQTLLDVPMQQPSIDGAVPESATLELEDKDAKVYGECWQRLEDLNYDYGEHPSKPMRNIIGKLTGTFSRILCNLHPMKYHSSPNTMEERLLVSDETVLEAERITLYFLAQAHKFWTTDYTQTDAKTMIPHEAEYKRVCKYVKKHKKPMALRYMGVNIFKAGGAKERDDVLKVWEDIELGYITEIGKSFVFTPTP